MELLIAWWNVQNLAHFDLDRRVERRWPESEDAFSDKLASIVTVLREGILRPGIPVVLGLAEVTSRAAEALRDRVLPGYRVESLDSSGSSFDVAFIYPPDDVFRTVAPFAVAHVPRGTRPMAVIDHVQDQNRTRFIACHWTARFEEESKKYRSETARQLGRYIFDYFAESAEEARHLVLVGDMNEEPFGLLEEELHAQRTRLRAAEGKHWRDDDVGRKYLYNLSWRWTGEHRAFNPGQQLETDASGTYHYKGKWHTFDHLIVDGSLLSEPPPLVDEASAHVVVHPLLFGRAGVPKSFSWVAPGEFSGVSDHLPIAAILHL
jgi:hypothetical protein